MNRAKHVRVLLALGVVMGTLGVAGLTPAVAGANTSVTLYVRSGATGHACTAPTPTKACDSISEGVVVASGESGTVTITVGAGTYFTRNVTLSTGGESSLTINGAGATSTYFYNTFTTSVFVLETGFVPVTIDGASVEGGTSCPGGGIGDYPRHTIVLRHDTFRYDYSCTGGAVYLAFLSHATFTDDKFTTDGATTGGAVDLFTFASASFTSDIFATDDATTGGAVFITTGANASFTSDNFARDGATMGGAVFVKTGASASFTSDNFARDAATTGGAVFVKTGASASFTGDTFAFDHAGRRGGAIAVFNTSSATVSGADFSDDEATTNGDAIAVILSAVTVDTSAVAGSCYVYRATLSGTYDVLSGTAVTSCGRYLHSLVSANCLPRAIACDSSFARPGRSVTVESGGASATYTGRGSVSIGTFRSDPVGAFGGSGATFFGVSISTGTGGKSLVITIPSQDAGNALMWWNGSSWQPVDAIASCGTTTCAEFIFSATSTPSLATIVKLSRTSRFGGVIFAVE